MKKTMVIVSGGFDPIHKGHLELFRRATKFGKVICIVNSDEFLINKKGYAFQTLQERITILRAIKYLYRVVPCVDLDNSVCSTLRALKAQYPDRDLIFANGGDRHIYEIPEAAVCKELGIKMYDGLGGKIQSSSTMVRKAKEAEGKLNVQN